MYVIIRSLSRHAKDPIPFRVFLVSLRPTYSQNMGSNGGRQLRMFLSKPNIGRMYTSPGLKGLNTISMRNANQAEKYALI
jgi:hypothetical protein